MCEKKHLLSTVYLCLGVQREKLLPAFIPVDLIELVCLPGVLHTHTYTHIRRM